MEKIRVYADTSVYGGVFDDEFSAPSRTFFDQVREGRFQLLISRIVEEETRSAPVHVIDFFSEISRFGDSALTSEPVLSLQQEYLKAEILGSKWEADALHVALATVSECEVIVSWNFRHIVHFDKISLYNKINSR